MTPLMISACEAHAISVMQILYPEVPIIMSGQSIRKEYCVYVRFWVIPSDETVQMDISDDSKSRNVGLVQADVYGPKDRGAGKTGEIAFALAKAFHRIPLIVDDEGTIVFKDGSVKDMGDAEEEHRQMMRIPYRYDFKM